MCHFCISLNINLKPTYLALSVVKAPMSLLPLLSYYLIVTGIFRKLFYAQSYLLIIFGFLLTRSAPFFLIDWDIILL